MQGCPAMMAMVAGVAPCWRTTASTSKAVCRFWGYGMPAAVGTHTRMPSATRAWGCVSAAYLHRQLCRGDGFACGCVAEGRPSSCLEPHHG